MSQDHRVVLDPADAYPELAALQNALTRHDWPACRRILDAVDPYHRTALIDTVSTDGDGSAEFLRGAVRDDRRDGTATALLAHHLINTGWEVRTAARARDVSREQWTEFYEWLVKAEQLMLEGAARHPHDLAIATKRLASARGLSLGQAEARRRYDRVAAIEPHHIMAQRHMVQQLAPKWGGSFEALHEFTRGAMLAAPPGAQQGSLVVRAHIEEAIAQPTHAERIGHLRSARHQFYEAAQRSIGDPGFRRTYGWVGVANVFACVFALIEDRAAAAWPLRMLGDLADDFGWSYFHPDATTAIRDARVWALGSPA